MTTKVSKSSKSKWSLGHLWILAAILTCLAGCRACVEQYDPTERWNNYRIEEKNSKIDSRLSEEGKVPEVDPDQGDLAQIDPTDKAYNNFCSSCHGAEGKGDGAAGAAMNPKPRNFVEWTGDQSNDDAYIAKIIKEGGAAVGKSALMSAWGGVLNDEQIAKMVQKVKSFRN